jgi:hypothetical protein
MQTIILKDENAEKYFSENLVPSGFKKPVFTRYVALNGNCLLMQSFNP